MESFAISRDRFATFWKWLFLGAGGLTVLIAARADDFGPRRVGVFYALLLSVVLGMFLMASSLDLVLVGSFPTFLGFTIISATAVIITVACYLWAAEKQACG